MNVYNLEYNLITDYDLTKGKLITRHRVKDDVKPIDNVTKFAWELEDFEEIQVYIPIREKSAEEKIDELKAKLNATDYKIIKCSECQLIGYPLPYDIVALHTERQALRDEINELEQEL